MHRIRRVLALTASIAVVAACDVERISFGVADGAARRWDPWIVTDRAVYPVFYTATGVEADIGFTFHNRSRSTVVVPACGGQPHRPVLEKLIHGEWFEVFTPLEECWGEPLRIGPGATRSYTFRVRAARPHTGLQPRFETDHVPGIYRLRWAVHEVDADAPFRLGWPLPLEYRVSNEFRLTH